MNQMVSMCSARSLMLALTLLSIMVVAPKAVAQKGPGGTVATGTEVHILWTGICTLNHRNADVAEVVDVSVPKDDMGEGHMAFIAAESDYALDVPGVSAETIDYDGNTHHFTVFWLDKADNVILSVKNANVGTQKAVEKEPVGGSLGDATDTANLYFVPRLSRVLHNTNCMPSGDSFFRLTTSGGEFRAYVTNPFVQEFRPPTAVGVAMHRQQAAHLVDWEISTADGLLALVDAKGKTFATAKPKGGRVVIVMGSGPKQDLRDAVKTGGQNSSEDPHFKHYYRGCAVGVKPIPANSFNQATAVPPPNFAPPWMIRNTQYVTADAVQGKRDVVPAFLGGLNCGPDQQP